MIVTVLKLLILTANGYTDSLQHLCSLYENITFTAGRHTLFLTANGTVYSTVPDDPNNPNVLTASDPSNSNCPNSTNNL